MPRPMAVMNNSPNTNALLILYRPTNTGGASLHTSVVLVRAMVHQARDVAEAY